MTQEEYDNLEEPNKFVLDNPYETILKDCKVLFIYKLGEEDGTRSTTEVL